jgi:formate dehydrogenase subunit delta
MDRATLIRMANDIARNLAPQGEDSAIEQATRHLKDFWDPRMKAAILSGDRSGLDPIAAAAVAGLEAA